MDLRSRYWDGQSQGFSESFTYDQLNRLETSTVNGQPLQRITYDAGGNIKVKDNVSSQPYQYPAPGASRPHGVTSIGGYGAFTYDGNGNQRTAPGRTTTWTSFDMPLMMTKGAVAQTYVYGPEHQRLRMNRSDDGSAIVYGGTQEVELKGGVVERIKTYWPNGIGLEIDKPGSATELLWTHADRLGSIIALSDASGALKERMAYDAWGKRRSLDGTSTPDDLDGKVDHRGFTGHEMLDQLDLVHMNGRVYDPLIARFLSADPLIQDPTDGQSYNRYTYVFNNPTNFTDPTGFAGDPAKEALTKEARGYCRGSAMGLSCVTQAVSAAMTFLANNPGAAIVNTAGEIIATGQSVSKNSYQIPIASNNAETTVNAPPPVIGKVTSAGEGADGKREIINLRLKLEYLDNDGKPVDNDKTRKLTKSAEKLWSGKIGNFLVVSDFNSPNATIVKIKVSSEYGVSVANKVGGNSVVLFMGGYQKGEGSPIKYSEETLKVVFGHEIGHVLGAGDRYDRNTYKAFLGFENDIMGTVKEGARPTSPVIKEIIEFNKRGK